MIQFVSDLRQVGGLLRVLRFPPPINLTNRLLNFAYIVYVNDRKMLKRNDLNEYVGSLG